MKTKARRVFKPKSLVLQDVCGTELDFPEVELGESPGEGDTVHVDGQKCTGSYLMPDGSTIIAVDGEVVQIVNAEEEVIAKLKKYQAKSQKSKKKSWRQRL